MDLTAAARVGLFGGAFDPPHRAHVMLAETAVRQLSLSVLHVCPTGHAWHKARGLTDASHRLAMARLAFADVPNALVDDREIRRTGPTYTVETLRELRGENPGARLYLVMGEDQAGNFTTWRDWQEIGHLATLCIARRPAPGAWQPMPGPVPVLPPALPRGVRSVELEMPMLEVSATEIRRALTAGEDIPQLVPAGVARYIAQHELYRTN